MTNVFANGLEISAKASKNKSIAALPDVCLSPPAPPAGPAPLPYPNTAFASDTKGGTKTVKIAGKEAGKKGKSTYSKSTGDEPATRTFGANLITHGFRGPMRFAAWSFDVKFEGANVTRFTDLTTHNHLNTPGASAVTASVAGVEVHPPTDSCEELDKRNEAARKAMTDDPRKTVSGVGEGKTTITNATYTPAGGQASVSMRACSRASVAKFDGGFVQGKNFGQKGGTTTVCGKPYPHPPSGHPKSSHTEARILETIMSLDAPTAAAKPTLLMAIDWNKSKTRDKPCPDCTAMICQATQCVNISICENGRPTPPPCE